MYKINISNIITDKIKNLIYSKNTDLNILESKILGSIFDFDGSEILLSKFGFERFGYPIFRADLRSNTDSE